MKSVSFFKKITFFGKMKLAKKKKKIGVKIKK